MPELPEVETTRRGLLPHLIGAAITAVVVRQPRLRWPIPPNLADILPQQTIHRLTRRAKYLLLHCDSGTLIVHLGMSGSLRILLEEHPPEKHDHFDLVCGAIRMRLRDPRRFGAVLWHEGEPATHPLLAKLGVEPLEADFDADFLYQATRRRATPIKLLIMDQHRVVGVGNIYASEALYRARIHPQIPAQQLSLADCGRLVTEIRQTLTEAIQQGGSTLRDFVSPHKGSPAIFSKAIGCMGEQGKPAEAAARRYKCYAKGNAPVFIARSVSH